MAATAVRELLAKENESLPDELAEEVLDFVQLVKAKRAEEAFLWQQVEADQAYREKHPDEVHTVTAEEWEAETAVWEDQG